MKRPVAVPQQESVTETLLAAHLRAGGGLCLSIEEAGRMLGVKKTKAHDMANFGELPTITVGGKRVVSIRQLLDYLETRESQARWKRA